MSDALRAPHCWDLVWIGCGRSKRAERSEACDLYTGPVFAAHRAIAEHLDVGCPQILSAQHGVLNWRTEIDPYEATLGTAAARKTWSALVLRRFLDAFELERDGIPDAPEEDLAPAPRGQLSLNWFTEQAA